MKIDNRKNVKLFTDELFELMNNQKINLVGSLELLENTQKNKRLDVIEKTASFIRKKLQEGESLSSILKVCPYLEFDNLYISFISLSEKNGNLLQSLSFLKSKCNREMENRRKVIESVIYPFFVIVISLVFGVALVLYKKSLFHQEGSGFSVLAKSFLFMALFVICGFVLLKNVFDENKLYEAFLVISFQIKAEMNLASAICCVIEFFGSDSKYGIFFESVREKIEYGSDIRKAFFITRSILWNSKTRSQINNLFFLAEKSGGKSDVFEKAASCIFEKSEMTRNYCMKLIEPMCIVGVGLFLLSIVITLYMPSFSMLKI